MTSPLVHYCAVLVPVMPYRSGVGDQVTWSNVYSYIESIGSFAAMVVGHLRKVFWSGDYSPAIFIRTRSQYVTPNATFIRSR